MTSTSHRDPKLPLIPARQPPRRRGLCQRPLEQGPPEGRTYFVFIARRYRVPVTKDIKYSVGTLQKCYKSNFAGIPPFFGRRVESVGQRLGNSLASGLASIRRASASGLSVGPKTCWLWRRRLIPYPYRVVKLQCRTPREKSWIWSTGQKRSSGSSKVFFAA